MQISGSVVLITGGANRGIGRAFVEGFAAAGARKIYAAARDPATIDDPRVQLVLLDITDHTQVEAASALCGDVSVLVNNAGVLTSSPLLQAPSMTAARLEMETNYFGTLAMCRAFAPVLCRHGGGALVNILSLQLDHVGSGWIIFRIEKSGSCADTWRAHRAPRTTHSGCRCEFPQFIDTDMTAHIPAEKASPQQVVDATLAGIAADEEEVVPDQAAARLQVVLREDPEHEAARAQRVWDERHV